MPTILNLPVLLGCDPEVFVVKKKTGEPVSAHGLIPGTKQSPKKVKKGMVQVDGMALEFGIDPAYTVREFSDNIQTVITQLEAMLPAHLRLDWSLPTVLFAKEVIAAQPPEALELGCEPDYSAYTLKANPRPKLPAGKLGLRSAGGHIHVGWGAGFNTSHPSVLHSCATLASAMDDQLFGLSYTWDKNEERRTLYGAKGAFRPKPYGMEYRSLSNQWVLSEELRHVVFEKTCSAVEQLLKQEAGSLV